MAEAGVDISILKAHSIRRGSCSTAAIVGLNAANRSLDGTF